MIIIINSCIILSIIVLRFYFIKYYGKYNIDLDNHLAYLNAMENDNKIHESAMEEDNVIPPLPYFFLKHLNKNNIKYFSFIVDIIFISIFLFYMLYFENYTWDKVVINLLIYTLLPSLFMESLFFSGRMLGIVGVNLIYLVFKLPIDIRIKAFLLITLFTFIFFSSKFANQFIVLILLPVSIIMGDYIFIICYLVAIFVSILISRGQIIGIFKGHVLHCTWSFKNQIEFYFRKNYFREFEKTRVSSSEVDLVFTLKKLVFFLKEPIILTIAFLTYKSNFNSLFPVLVIVTFALYLVLSIFVRLDKTIGESNRYFEYVIIPLIFIFNNSNAGFNYIFYLCFFILLINVIQKNYQGKKNFINNRGSSNDIVTLTSYLSDYPPSKIISFPIGLSNKLAQKLKMHKFYYPYSYKGSYFLTKKGIFPYFSLKENLLHSSEDVQVIILYRDYVNEDVEKKLQQLFHLTLDKRIGKFIVYKNI